MPSYYAIILLVCALPATAGAAARHSTFAGSNPAGWSAASIDQRSADTQGEFTTYIGDSNEFRVSRIVTDAQRNTLIVGSRVFGQLAEVFVSKLDRSGNLLFTTTLSGKGHDEGRAIALDSSGSIYVGGSTSSRNFPLRNAHWTQPENGFVAKLSSDGSRLIYSTYFPGEVNAIAVDAGGNAYLTGATRTPDFPVTAGLPNPRLGGILAGVIGAFITKLDAAGSRIVFSGAIAGNTVSCGAGSSCFLSMRITSGIAIALDGAGDVYVAGNTNTTDLPTTAGTLKARGIGGFVAKVNRSGSALSYLTYIGETQYPLSPNANPANTIRAMAVDETGNAYLAGETSDPDFPATEGAYQRIFAGTVTEPHPLPLSDAFIAKLNPQGTAMVYATYLGGADRDSVSDIALDAAGSAWVTGTTAWDGFPNANGWTQGGDFVVAANAAGSALDYSVRLPDGAAGQAIALDGDGQPYVTGRSGILSRLTSGQPTAARVFGVANAAAGPVSGRVVAGEAVSLYGPRIGGSMADTQVYFDEIAAPLLYVSANQINAVVPFGLKEKTATSLRVVTGGTMLPELRLGVTAAMPEIFRHTDGLLASVNQDGTLNSETSPAAVGSVVSIWATGVSLDRLADGEIATGPVEYYCCKINVDWTEAEILYGGAAPGIIAGIVQVNFRVPEVAAGARYVTLKSTYPDVGSSAAQLWVKE